MTTNQDRYAGKNNWPADEKLAAIIDQLHAPVADPSWNQQTGRYTWRGRLAWIIYRLFHPRIST